MHWPTLGVEEYIVNTIVLLHEWCQRYLPCYLFSVSNSVWFSSMSVSQAAQRRTGLLNIGHRTLPKICVGFLYGAYSPEEWLNWFPAVKMETRHPVEGSVGSEFSVICNHCIVMGLIAAWSRKTLKFWEKFLNFLEKRPLR